MIHDIAVPVHRVHHNHRQLTNTTTVVGLEAGLWKS